MQRFYLQKSIYELESMVSNANSTELLQKLADELEHRKTHRAKLLASKVKNLLDSIPEDGANENSILTEEYLPSEPEVSDELVANSSIESTEIELENSGFSVFNLEALFQEASIDISDSVIARLASWCALEALSPQTYRKPEDLSSDGRYGVAKLGDELPWTEGERSRKNCRLYYEIILGTIDIDMADEKLAAIFGKDEEKQRRSNGKAVIASILVDKKGIPVEDVAAVSSFAWAFPIALEKSLTC